ncbi:AmmeMemoRadiSam system protein A [candidate division WOR-3 bacterium]|nr:AmmeMemoRadiSam system protein A [candidate division WOR-3 bacterium]
MKDDSREFLDEKEKSTLLRSARQTLIASAKGDKRPQPSEPFGKLTQKRGIFVTLHKREELRGCIGFLTGVKPLFQAVVEMAWAASREDPRFFPVSETEIKEIEIEISVLTPLEKISDIENITVGEDGLIVKKGFWQGLLLPQVATEWGWDRETFLDHTCVKAGLSKGCWKSPDVEIFSFKAQVFSESDL